MWCGVESSLRQRERPARRAHTLPAMRVGTYTQWCERGHMKRHRGHSVVSESHPHSTRTHTRNYRVETRHRRNVLSRPLLVHHTRGPTTSSRYRYVCQIGHTAGGGTGRPHTATRHLELVQGGPVRGRMRVGRCLSDPAPPGSPDGDQPLKPQDKAGEAGEHTKVTETHRCPLIPSSRPPCPALPRSLPVCGGRHLWSQASA